MSSRFSLRSLSLTTRLALFFTLAAAAGVLGLGLLFVRAADRHFIELDEATLQDKRRLIEAILATASSADDARHRLADALRHHGGLHVAVQDAAGGVLFEMRTRDGDAAGAASAPGATAGGAAGGDAGHGAGHAAESRGVMGHGFHALRFEAAPAYAPRAVLRVLLQTGTQEHERFLAELRTSLLLYALLATVVIGLLAAWAAHHGLAPLRAMRERAAAVSAQRLDERMPAQAVPVEMADLAHELNRMLDRLQQDFQRLSDFSSDLAHELRTPISNLLTQTQVALSGPRDAATYREILASNAEEFQRLGRMVADMLFLAKTEHGVELPHKEQFAAAPEAQALLEFYEAVAEEKGVRLQLDGDAPLVGDRLMLRRALSNLLSNALRHTPPGGEVRLRIADSAGAVSLSVENTGEPIPPGLLPRLFDRFFMADPARAHPQVEGAGLGLAITRAIVQAHGGTASVRREGGWTCFVLRFPAPDSDVRQSARGG